MKILCRITKEFGGHKKGDEVIFSLTAYKLFKDKLEVLKVMDKKMVTK